MARVVPIRREQAFANPSAICTSAPPSPKSCIFCTYKKASYLQILHVLKVIYFQGFARFCSLSPAFSALAKMGGRGLPSEAPFTPGAGRAMSDVSGNRPFAPRMVLREAPFASRMVLRDAAISSQSGPLAPNHQSPVPTGSGSSKTPISSHALFASRCHRNQSPVPTGAGLCGSVPRSPLVTRHSSLLILRRVIPLPRQHLRVRPRHLDLDFAETAIVRRVGRVVAHHVLAAQLLDDLLESFREALRPLHLDHAPAGFLSDLMGHAGPGALAEERTRVGNQQDVNHRVRALRRLNGFLQPHTAPVVHGVRQND